VAISGLSEEHVRVRGFTKSFPTRKKNEAAIHAVGPLDLAIAPGEIVVLIGPSGCGKTTLLRALSGLLEPTSGTITINSQTPTQAKADKQFSFVPQTPTLLPWRTVRQNANLLLEVNKGSGPQPLNAKQIDQLLVKVGLGGFENAKPRQLSGGMQQRVSLVRAFALGAPMLLLDEPFAALDEFTRADMRNLLLTLWSENELQRDRPTIVFTTHSLEEAVLLADRVIVMAPRPGRIVADVSVQLDRPTREGIEDTPKFAEYVREVRSHLREGIQRAHTNESPVVN
jgi:NitT/TauT family transport system ATP-binding protein